MPEIKDSNEIVGVQIIKLVTYQDERGRFSELFRKEWFPQRAWGQVQCNRSQSFKGVLRGLHYHHRQVDYWHVIKGTILAGLVDLRRSSPSYRSKALIILDGHEPTGLFIPAGVAHGFFSKSDAILLYVVDNYYDGSDEYGLAWNDPTIGVNWGTTTPLLSERDSNNPHLRDIPPEDLPD